MSILGWIVSILLIGISGGVVLVVMYFGTRDQHHDETPNNTTTHE